VWITETYQGTLDPLAVPTGRVSAEAVIDALTPPAPNAEVRARALVKIEAALSRALRLTLQSTPERARELGAALVGSRGEPSFGPLGQGLDALDPAQLKAAQQAAARLSRDAVPGFLLLASHPQSSIRQAALLFLSFQNDVAAKAALTLALDDVDPEVQRLVLGGLAERPFAEALDAVARLLASDGDWSLRVLALQAVAKFPPLGTSARNAETESALTRIRTLATSDRVAYVREAALRALHNLDPKLARETLAQAKARDAEPRVQKAATELLGQP
jgi:HEAT repeat protein